MSIGFAIDMDGVLRRDKHPIPGSRDAIGLLEQHGIPYLLLSNSGVLPDLLTHEITEILGSRIDASKIVNTATVALDYLRSRPKETVILIVGAAGLSLPIMKKAGHRNCIFTMQAVMRHNVGINQGNCDIQGQYDQWLRENHVSDDDFFISTYAADFPTTIDEILFCNDSNTWYLDVQILVEVLVRKGSFSSSTPDGTKQPPIFVTNPDISYGGNYIISRLTLGSLLASTCEIYRQMTKRNDLQIHFLGKPYEPIFSVAQSRLNTDTVYMIGDSLTSDIAGANRKKQDGWISVLVLTGQTKEDDLRSNKDEEKRPVMVFSDIKEAVTTIISKHKIN